MTRTITNRKALEKFKINAIIVIKWQGTLAYFFHKITSILHQQLCSLTQIRLLKTIGLIA